MTREGRIACMPSRARMTADRGRRSRKSQKTKRNLIRTCWSRNWKRRAKGCEALVGNWRALRERIEEGLGFQPPDRLKLLRMVGKQPLDVTEDRVIAQVYVASFAVHPFGRKNAYQDLQSDTNRREHKLLLKRIRSRWPLVMDASDTATAKQFLLDLIDRNIAGLEAKLAVHRERADLYAKRTAHKIVYENSREGESLRRLQMAWDRRYHRSKNGFWKHRRETEGDEGEMEEVAVEGPVPEVGAARDGEASGLENKNVTNEANLETGNPEVATEKQVVNMGIKTECSVDDFLTHERGEFERFSTPAAADRTGRGLVEASIFRAGR